MRPKIDTETNVDSKQMSKREKRRVTSGAGETTTLTNRRSSSGNTSRWDLMS